MFRGDSMDSDAAYSMQSADMAFGSESGAEEDGLMDTMDTDAEMLAHLEGLKRQAIEESLELIKAHLESFLQRNPHRTYEDWIGELHPENIRNKTCGGPVSIDHRFYVEASDHRQLWNKRVGGHLYVPAREGSSSFFRGGSCGGGGSQELPLLLNPLPWLGNLRPPPPLLGGSLQAPALSAVPMLPRNSLRAPVRPPPPPPLQCPALGLTSPGTSPCPGSPMDLGGSRRFLPTAPSASGSIVAASIRPGSSRSYVPPVNAPVVPVQTALGSRSYTPPVRNTAESLAAPITPTSFTPPSLELPTPPALARQRSPPPQQQQQLQCPSAPPWLRVPLSPLQQQPRLQQPQQALQQPHLQGLASQPMSFLHRNAGLAPSRWRPQAPAQPQRLPGHPVQDSRGWPVPPEPQAGWQPPHLVPRALHPAAVGLGYAPGGFALRNSLCLGFQSAHVTSV